MNRLSLILFLLFPLSIVACSSPWEPYEVAHYAIHCPAKPSQERSISLLSKYGPYKVYPSSQLVIGEGGSDPYKFEDCAIYDKNNWACKYNDGSGYVRFREGTYFPPYERFINGINVTLSKREYLYYYWTRKIWGSLDYSDVCRRNEKYWKDFIEFSETIGGLMKEAVPKK